MTTEGRFDRLETSLDKAAEENAATRANLDRLAQVAAAIAAPAAAHNDRIERLIQDAEISRREWEQLRREWQAYLTTIRSRQ
jgi:hypothetical protein